MLREHIITKSAATMLAIVGLLGFQIASAPFAQAVEAVTKTETISQFNNGQIAKVKVSLEKDLGNSKFRAKVAVWCEGGSGNKEFCSAVDLSGADLGVDYWNDADLKWYLTRFGLRKYPAGTLNAAPPLTTEEATGWYCGNHGPNEYRSAILHVRVRSLAGQWGSYHDTITPTYVGNTCSG